MTLNKTDEGWIDDVEEFGFAKEIFPEPNKPPVYVICTEYSTVEAQSLETINQNGFEVVKATVTIPYLCTMLDIDEYFTGNLSLFIAHKAIADRDDFNFELEFVSA